jgi:hypothetical protein
MKVALALHRLGLRGSLMHSLGIGSILAAISLWGRSAAVSDKHRRALAERLAIFVGLWPPTFILLGKVLQDIEATPDEQVSQARGAEATRKAKEAVPAYGSGLSLEGCERIRSSTNGGTMAVDRGKRGGLIGGLSLGGILVIVGVIVALVWSLLLGIIIALIGLIAFGGFVRGKWY